MVRKIRLQAFGAYPDVDNRIQEWIHKKVSLKQEVPPSITHVVCHSSAINT